MDQPQVTPLPRAVPLHRGQQDVGPSAVQRDPSLPTEEKHVREKIDEGPRPAEEQAAEQFSRLCENVKDLYQRNKQGARMSISESSEERRPRRAEVPVGNVAS